MELTLKQLQKASEQRDETESLLLRAAHDIAAASMDGLWRDSIHVLAEQAAEITRLRNWLLWIAKDDPDAELALQGEPPPPVDG